MTATKFVSKKLIIAGLLAVGVLAVVLVASSIAQAKAQEQMMWRDQGMPEIKGSVNVTDKARDFIKENAKVSLIEAAEIAQKQVTEGTLLGGHIGVVQGYLVYTFIVAELDDETSRMVVIDAGNGKVLYTSEAHPMGSFGPPMFGGHGPWKGHGYGGHWHGFGGGMWK